MRVAAFQFDVRPAAVEENLAAVEPALRSAAAAGVQLVCLPEMWATSFPRAADGLGELLEQNERGRSELERWSAELGIAVAGSALAPPRSSAGSDGRPVNRLELFDAGRAVLSYDKVHLFSPTAEPASFSAGARPPGTARLACDSAAGTEAATQVTGVVCYDLRFGPLVHAALRGGAQVLLCPAQWPSPRATHWRALAIGRAVEGQCYVVACNRTGSDRIGRRELPLAFPGNSLVVDPHGRVLAEGRGAAGLVRAELDLDAVRRLRTRVPVAKDRRDELYASWSDPAGDEPA